MSGGIRGYLLVAQTPFDHLIDRFYTSAQLSGLESLVFQVCKHFVIINTLIEVVSLNPFGIKGFRCWVGFKIPITSLVELFQLYFVGNLI
jgi:hypothetical protein